MCGFVAVLAGSNRSIGVPAIQAATDLLTHRGPDDSGYFTDGQLAFGFRRLSIFDLSSMGHQPMVSPDNRHVIVFNGAIYNWPELRRDLETLGHVFATKGDTEVLLQAWRQWGSACLHRFNGMFAFLIWDRTKRVLFGARDRFGVKPMYWARNDRDLMFASEIKSIRALTSSDQNMEADWDTVADFLENGRIDARDQTFFKGIERVPAGTCFVAEPGGRIRWTKWWSLESAASSSPVPADPPEEFAALFEDAVRLRMRGDVPYGVLLSGGLDSTSIICAMARNSNSGGAQRAFAFVSPAAEQDETVALNETLTQTGALLERLSPDPRDLLLSLERHLWNHDEPVYSLSSLISEYLVNASRRAGVKILLNGQGADEVLGGYPAYYPVYWSQLIREGQLGVAVASMRAISSTYPEQAKQLMARAVRDALLRTARAMPMLSRVSLRRRARIALNDWIDEGLQTRAIPFRQAAHSTLECALQGGVEQSDLPIYLRQEDRNAMAHGVEARLPFLDHRLVTLAFSLGDDWKLMGSRTKRLLRDAMRGRIPEVVRTEPRKLGFATPLDSWFRGPLREPMGDLLNSREFRESGMWNAHRVVADFDGHQAGRISCGTRLFDVAQTVVWMRTFRK